MQKAVESVEALLARLWRETLKIDEIAQDADFFDLGATSLQVIAVIHQLQAELDQPFGFEILADGATIRDVANRLRNGN